jgi:hypothetical protein
MHHGKETGCIFFEARCEASHILHFAKEPVHDIPMMMGNILPINMMD